MTGFPTEARLSDESTPSSPAAHAVVAGFGVPGRNCADWLARHGRPFVVIERNPATVDRCARVGLTIRAGDATDEATLRSAGIEGADLLVVTIPDEAVATAVVMAARRLNPTVRILARMSHVSAALDAVRRGADEAVAAEELVAREFVRLLDGGRSAFRAHDGHAAAMGDGVRA